MNRIAVLSDLHISPPGPLTSFHLGYELAALIRDLRTEHAVDTLILAGDVFDFLAIPTATASMHPENVPTFVGDALNEIANTESGLKIFQALGAFARSSGQIIVIPGNHDPELAHPEVPGILRTRCDLPADDARLAISLQSAPWRAQLGTLEVVIGHGHRGDPWNDIDPAMVLHHATMNPPAPLELPPGSRLVVGAMRAFRTDYAFVDALKPETPGVPLMLLYLNPKRALLHIPSTAANKLRAFIGGLHRRLRGGPVLGTAEQQQPQPLNELDALGASLVGALAPEERTDGTIAAIEDWLAGHADTADGTLATHNGRRYLLRAALRLLGRNGTAFDQTRTDDFDNAIIAEHLPPNCGRRVIITGHTHAARFIRIDEERTYINTGTWSDLIPWPPLDSDDKVRRFIDDLEANKVAPLRRMTWALVEEAGARLVSRDATST
ncbi:MAG: metallophosphoesterase [Deltaproteobacteria bacterium]|nr:metallophosphoesterase [Deltaproteobacteria bacterium]